MRYHWGLGVGHFHAHGLTSTSFGNLGLSSDTDAPDNSSKDSTEMCPIDTDSNACYESINPEMTLDERDLEGWEDVESDGSCEDGEDNDSVDDFGDMYE
jgi:hypothetical protein